jgi:membrane-associated phospholipid phosphatase
MKLTLVPVKVQHKWVWFGGWYAGFCLLYLGTGLMPLRVPVALPLVPLDARIPFLPWTMWVYLSQFLFLALGIGVLRTTSVINRVWYAMCLATLLSSGVFLCYPMTYPRQPAPTTGVTAAAFRLLYWLDPTSNYFPSLHVALACLMAWGLVQEHKPLGYAAVCWALLICLSTLTTKQHYTVDVLAGFAVAVLCSVVVWGGGIGLARTV